MTTYASTCTRIYSPNGAVAHLSSSRRFLDPLCAARGRTPPGGWLGDGWSAEREHAAELPLCKHCERLAAKQDAPPPDPQTSAGQSPRAPVRVETARDAATAPESTPPLGNSPGLAAPDAPAGPVLPKLSAGAEDASPAGSSGEEVRRCLVCGHAPHPETPAECQWCPEGYCETPTHAAPPPSSPLSGPAPERPEVTTGEPLEPPLPDGPPALRGEAWRKAAKKARSALNATLRRKGQTYVRQADRSTGSRYGPGQNRRGGGA